MREQAIERQRQRGGRWDDERERDVVDRERGEVITWLGVEKKVGLNLEIQWCGEVGTLMGEVPLTNP